MIKSISPISFRWDTQNPFLFVAHHVDHYPAGNNTFGVEARYLKDRQMGSDFSGLDGFNMYHGEEVPGFPVHPHRGFETITIVRRGYADHADSLGAIGRYGEGDVQWMTAGSGVQHSEMFPLLHTDKENTLELFQIWLNLPKKDKMADPGYKMLWAESIPRIPLKNGEALLINGEYENNKYYHSPPASWAKDPENQVTIMMVTMHAGGEFKYPGRPGLNRSFYFFEKGGATINGQKVNGKNEVRIDSQDDVVITTEETCEFIIMDARPINEPVVQYGPFVMNTKEEIMQTINDYQRTQFGGWKYDKKDMVHGPKIERFSKLPDGTIERPDVSSEY